MVDVALVITIFNDETNDQIIKSDVLDINSVLPLLIETQFLKQ